MPITLDDRNATQQAGIRSGTGPVRVEREVRDAADLPDDVDVLKQTIMELVASMNKLAASNAKLAEQLEYMLRRYQGRQSEKMDAAQLALLAEMLGEAASAAADDARASEEKEPPKEGLLAHVIMSKFDDHVPVYRQEEIFKRNGIDINRSTMCGWLMGCAAALEPVYKLMALTPSVDCNEGKTPALSDAQARKLLGAPDTETLKGKRDRAIIAVYLFHALRRTSLATLNVGSMVERRGVMHFRVRGKGSKTRYVPVHPAAMAAIDDHHPACRCGRRACR